MNVESPQRRAINTFVRRSSPLTQSQKCGLSEYAPLFKVSPDCCLDSQHLFANEAPLTIEIGFGMGQSLVSMAVQYPERNFLGIEVHIPGIAQICFDAGQRSLNNLRILEGDALKILPMHCPPHSVDRIQLFFPDPWPKKRHHKRRLINPVNVALLHSFLRPGGVLHMATDWLPYAEWMLNVMTQASGYENLAGVGNYHDRPAYRPLTRFELRGLRDDHPIRDLLFMRTSQVL